MSLRWIITNVLDVSEDMAAAVLTHEVSKICSQTHISYGGFVISPFLNWESFEEDEALSIEDLSLDRGQ
jgi:hypothetical protein